MDNINDLYKALDAFNKYSKEELIQVINDKEEEFLSTEVIPFLEKKLSTLKRDFELTIVYKPGEDIQYSLSHSDATSEKNNNHNISSQKTQTIQKKKYTREHKYANIRVITPNGEVIEDPSPKAAFVKVLQKIGVERVKTFKKEVMGAPFLYEGYNPKYNDYDQPLVSDTLRVNLCYGHERKKERLEELFKFLNLDWKVELIEA